MITKDSNSNSQGATDLFGLPKGRGSTDSIIRASWILNIIMAILKAVVGHLSGSQVLVADSYHSAIDSWAMGLNDFRTRLGSKESPAKVIMIGGVIVLLTFLTGVWIFAENLALIYKGLFVRPGLMALVMAIVALAVNISLYVKSKQISEESGLDKHVICFTQNRINLFTSVLSVVGICLADAGFAIMDTLSALVIAVVMFRGAYDLFKVSFNKQLSVSEVRIKKWILNACSILAVCIVIFITQDTVSSMVTRNNILIPAVTPAMDGPVDEFLGRSHFFIVYDAQKDASLVIDNNYYRQYQGEVSAHFLSLVDKYGIGVVVANKVGTTLFDELNSKDILVYYDETAGTVKTAITDYQSGALHRALSSNVAAGYARDKISWLSPW
ncbi:MAG: cation transporter [Deltaproteobacteria bacterium]|nr:cation transporter [Deltaproteobacteria bacterium]